ncbi:Clp protease N-terminal domain-containing protein [Streptomyces sp. NBC_01508]|uniref:Clp protease N-terminal domain-containing protein n=1 Tax=Streptomyces sp. NBC_01508 TaxID=2903888 RepID=UPI0038701D9C
MEQGQTAAPTTVTTTEFASDAIGVLSRAVRRATRRAGSQEAGSTSGVVGTEHLLFTFLDDTDELESALVSGMRESTSVSAQISARDERHWARDDSASAGADGAGAEGADDPDDVIEMDAAWREALAEIRDSGRRPSEPEEAASAPQPPEPSGALRQTLLGALRLAREEGSPDAHGRHLARAMLATPGSRALEALTLCRVDLDAAASALDAQAEAVRGGATPWTAEKEAAPGSVQLLGRAGLLGERGVWWARGMLSWMARTAGDGAPVLLVVNHEARRQAVRYGRTAAEPVDLLLAVPALDRGLVVAGESLPEKLWAANSVADMLRSEGVRQVDLVRAAASAAGPSATTPGPGAVKLSAEADKVVAAARLLAAERKAETVGTTHLLAALLADPEGAPTRLLRECGADPAALRTRLNASLGA